MRRWRYRPGQAAAVTVLAALVAACALFAPLYDRAMQQSLTQVTIDRAPVLTSSVQVSVSNADDILQPVTPPETVATLLPEHHRSGFRPVVLGYGGTSEVLPRGRDDPAGDLIWRTDQCEHVTIEAGRCPRTAGEVLVSRADARIFDLGVGATTEVSGRLYEKVQWATDASGRRYQRGVFLRARTLPLTVVGTYRQNPDDYWFGRLLTGRSGLKSQTIPSFLQHDVWLTARDTFEGASALANTTSSWAGYRIDPERAGVDEVRELGPAVAGLADRPQRLGGLPVEVTSGLADLATDIEDQIDQSRVTVPLLMAQLGLLASVVLWLVLLGVTEQRRPEVALAQLRGHGRRGARRLLLAELLPITLAGLVPGAVLALLAAWSARAIALPGDVSLELRLPVVLAFALAVVVLVAVTVVASARVSREPVAALLRRVPPRQSTWALGALDAVVVSGCGAVVVLFATGGLAGPAAMVAPALLAVVVGLLLAHVTTPAAGLLGRAQLRRGRLRAGVSILDAARSPVTRRTIAVVTLASALAVFSADALLIGDRNRASAAEQTAGAPLVADVQGVDLVSVRAALDEVDPDGRRVTPVVRVPAPDEDAGETLGVVPDGFRAVALFPGGAPDAEAWEALRPPDTPPVVLTGRTFTLDAEDSTLDSVRVDGTPYPVTVGVDLVTPTGEVLHTSLGRLSGPTDHAVLRGTAPCTEGCTVTSIWFSSLPGARIAGTVTLGPVEVAPSGERLSLGPADLWTPFRKRGTGSVVPRSTSADELTITVQGAGASLLTMQSAWMPDVTPTLTTGELPADADGRSYQLIGLHGERQPATQVGTLERVPGSGDRTFVANLDTLQRGRVVSPDDRIEVWFADGDPELLAEVTAALDDRGVAIARTTTLADVRQAYDDTAAAWSLQLAALVGVLAILIALLVLVVSAVSTWRVRARDLAALRMSGIPVRTVRSMAVAAQVPAVLLGVVAGTACGLAGASLVMPTVPLFAAEPEVSTLDLGTAWTGVVVAALAAAVVLGLASVLIGRALAARSDVRRLREAAL